MTRTAAEVLTDLLDATPDAPAPDADPDEVIAAIAHMVTGRDALLEELRTAPIEGDTEWLLAALDRRQAAWNAALVRVRGVLTQRLIASRRARARRGG